MATGTSKSDSDESGNRGEQIARISIKIPPLWRRNVKVWRLQVDAQFANSPVTQELTKYNYVLASLDGDVAELISDLLLKPLSNTPYTDLMTRLQTEFEISEGRKLLTSPTVLVLGEGIHRQTALALKRQSLPPVMLLFAVSINVTELMLVDASCRAKLIRNKEKTKRKKIKIQTYKFISEKS
ncbi:hypothetical protein GE061_002469 [Apolygus lucorum]|uniref:DUF7041 domain-containing protein n=1 Tax=Apolygus lucorum TaxID=248454 RepID=A0A8S9X6N2_APOLU|nr:hypothetical protein GE061_002469 [Apolygus lucorum]